MDELHDEVRAFYAAAASAAVASAGGASGTAAEAAFGASRYDELARAEVPEEALLLSLGCGNPTAVAELRPGEVVLDLGSGGGIDALLSARRVGPEGKVYGVDMTDEMLALALRNRDAAGVENVEFLKGYIEAVPLPAATVDVVISNCTVNLAADKRAVFSEMYRVLKPGGRIGVSDVVAADELTPARRAERGSYVSCIAGALSFAEYAEGLRTAGFADVAVDPTHEVTDGIYAAIVRAVRPRAEEQPAREPEFRIEWGTGGVCCGADGGG